ncbi:unnamed protein product [Larinioides sclopetarius]|uniref:Uncharacterized protein n=1 Tax=Larinioides sclopetarius TaxID=280406 RepID=A0AAV2BBQ1_9ARAC
MSIWNDSRLYLNKYRDSLASEFSIVYERCRHYIWTPDIFFENAKHIENFENTSPSTMLKVLPDGAIIMSTRYSFKAGCDMNFENYPFDSQKCVFYVSLSNYTSLLANFRMVRRLTGSIMNTYAPSTMIVTMSWVSFWIKVDAVPARVALSVTSLLTLCTQVEQYKSQLPPVNYIKAMDIWLFVCILMVFSSLLVFAVSYHLHSRKCKECTKEKKTGEKTEFLFKKGRKMKLYPLITDEDKQIKFIQSSKGPYPIQEMNAKECQKCLESQAWGPRVDEICKTVFPGSFLIFAIVYWVHYLRIYNGHLS